MAKVRQNIIIQGLSGSLGDQIVIKQDKAGRTIVSVMPNFDPDRQFTPGQLQQQEAFREAAAYGKTARTESVYIEKADGTTQNPYNVALADYLHEPEILDVDLEAWNGQVGQAIRVKALDDVQVQQVTVVITDEQDAVLEQGNAVQKDSLWWEYMTTATASGNPKVIASARDLPGHITKMTQNGQVSGHTPPANPAP